MQTAADAAAMAGATELFYNGSTFVNTKAYAAAKANGVDNTVTGNTVNVTIAPTLSGGGGACASCVEVQLSTPNPTVFMATFANMFSSSNALSSINVSAMGMWQACPATRIPARTSWTRLTRIRLTSMAPDASLRRVA